MSTHRGTCQADRPDRWFPFLQVGLRALLEVRGENLDNVARK